MANRPTDWHVLDLDRDPVPGDPFEVKELARKLGDFADDVSSALRSVRGLSGNNAVQDWAGLAADEYRKQFGDLPGELDKLERSYRLASGALGTYWPKLETAQADADRALSQGRAARQDLDAAKTTQTNANDWVKRTGDKSKEYQADPKPGVEPPSAEEVRTATRNALDASNAQKSANSAVHDAQQRLDAAKELAAQAAHLRDTAASTAEHALHEASDAGIKNKHWWEKAVDFVADHWDEIVAVCKVIVAVLGIVVMIIGGPLAWIVLAAALVVLADTLIKYAQGKASLWDVAFAALDCIPMFKGLTTLGGLAKMAKELPVLLKSGKMLETMANSIRKGANGLRETAVNMFKRNKCGDPIDVATGEMVMSATDVELPGVLPLVLERHHVSSYRAGRWFGRSWASTLDQRLIIDDQGVRYTSEDGMILTYPVPLPDAPVLPVEGPRWPLDWDGTPGGRMRISRPESGRTLHFQALLNGSPAELPLAAVTDRHDNAIVLEYAPDGVPTEVRHEGGYRIGLVSSERRITELRLLSHPDRPVLVRYGYNANGDLAEIINSSGTPFRLSYDNRHRVTGWEDRNNTWYRYEYDTEGRCVRTTGTDGHLDYTYAYDPGSRTTVVTNSLGQPTTYEFNEHFQLIRQTDPLGHSTFTAWDRYDNLISRTDPLGRTTHYSYDTDGHLTRFVRPDGAETVIEYDALGLPVLVTTADGAQWRHDYDDRGNRVRTVDPLGAETRRAYDSRGRLTHITDALGTVRRLLSNEAGLPTARIEADGTTTRYDYDAFGRLAGITDPLGGVAALAWSVEGKLVSRTQPDGTTERWVHDADGNLIEHTDANGAPTRFEPTTFDLLAARTNADGTRLEFAYDTELRLTSVTNSTGLSWTYEYDTRGILVKETDFNGRTLEYRYDTAGQLTERVNGAGQTTRFTRDAAGRAVEWRSGDKVTTMEYDPVDRVTRAVNADAELTFEHDLLGRAVTETCNGATLSHTYDVLGRRTQRRTPTGAVSEWEWGTDFRASALHTAGRRMSFSYDPAGRETERVVHDGVSLSREWDGKHRLVSQTLTSRRSAGGAGTLLRRSYSYRADDHIVGIDDRDTGSRAFSLDHAGRVTAVTAENWSESYAYDSAGNLSRGTWPTGPASSGAASGSADAEAGPGDRACTGLLVRRAGRTVYDHDAQGRIVRRSRKLLSGATRTWHFTWDADDRLTDVVTADGVHWRYLYDPLGRRIAKMRVTEDGSTADRVDFSWDGMRLAEQTRTDHAMNRTTAVTWDSAPGSHHPVSQTERVISTDLSQDAYDDRFYAIVTDAVGTPTELVDADGSVAWTAATTLWGTRHAAGPDRADCPLRFPGQYFDDETGLHYNVFRYYDPELGSYYGPDPLGLEPGPHHYAYVGNPLSWSDPLGLKCLEFFTVQGSDDAARFRGTGEPWPTEMHRAHFGPGVYSWGSRAEAEKYFAMKLRRTDDLELMRFTIHEKDFAKLTKSDISKMTDDEAQAFIDRYSLMSDTGKTDHGLQYITRPTGMGPEHFFDKSVFGLLKFD